MLGLNLSMLTLAVNWSSVGTMSLFVLFILASVLLVLTVLIQKPQGGGLAGAFGSGAGSGQTAFGARTGDALTVMTIIMFVVFLAGAIALGVMLQPSKVKPTTGSVGAPATAPADPAGEQKTESKPAETPASTTVTTTPMTTTTTVVPAETPKSEPKPEIKPEAPKPAETPKPEAPKTDAPKPADAPKP